LSDASADPANLFLYPAFSSPNSRRFQITRELGRGGMRIVYEAVDPVICRTVAVKTIRIDAWCQIQRHPTQFS